MRLAEVARLGGRPVESAAGVRPQARDEKELAGRTALITGAATGVGGAIATALSRRGAGLVLVDRDAARLAEVGREVRKAGGTALELPADVAAPSWLRLLDRPVDVVVHHAADLAGHARLEGHPEGEVDAALPVAARLLDHVLPGMRERGFGRIVLLGPPATGLSGLVRTRALEGAPSGVTVNLLELGLVDTERVHERVDPRTIEGIVARTPVGRLGTPAEIAEAVAFLASPRASYLTGVVLPVNGGLGLGLFPEQLG